MGVVAYLDAHKDQRLQFVFVEQRENLWRRHREERLFDRGEVERAERGQVEAVVGLAKSYRRSRGVCVWVPASGGGGVPLGFCSVTITGTPRIWILHM